MFPDRLLNELKKEAKQLRLALPAAFKSGYTTRYARRVMVELNRQQMNDGKTKDNKLITPKYSVHYARRKARMNKTVKGSPFTPNLNLTGAFQRAIFTTVLAKGVRFDSKDKKKTKLNKKYKRVFALNSESIATLNTDKRIVTDVIIQATRSI